MVALNFQKQFADDVESGVKAQTIRRCGKRKPPKVGDELQLYTAMRTKYCRLLRRVKCTEVMMITIHTSNQWVSHFVDNGFGFVWLPITGAALTKLFVEDGFDSLEQFCNFFASEHSPIFEGYLIKWGL